MERIRSALRRDIEYASGPAAEFRAVGVGLDAEFAHRFGAQKLSRSACRSLLRVGLDRDAIDHENVGCRARAGNDKQLAASQVRISAVVFDDAGLQCNELGKVAPIERK